MEECGMPSNVSVLIIGEDKHRYSGVPLVLARLVPYFPTHRPRYKMIEYISVTNCRDEQHRSSDYIAVFLKDRGGIAT